MSLLNNFGQALQHYKDAISLIQKEKLGGLFLLSCLLYLTITLISAYLMWLGLDQCLDYFLTLPFITTVTQWFENIPILLKLIKIGLYLSFFFVFISVYKYLFLALASPLYAYISERTAEIINQTTYKFNIGQFIHDVLRGIRISLRNFVVQIFLTSILLLLSFIPIVGWIFGLIIVVLDCYYYGFSMLDYNCERHKMSIQTSRKLIKSNKGIAIGNGLIMYLSLLIPILGIIFIAPLSAIAATISFYKNPAFASAAKQ
jgi:CysZ protein